MNSITKIEGADFPMQVRQLEQNELESLLNLYKYLHVSDEPLPNMSIAESAWREILESPYHFCFGGYEKGELVSSCVLVLSPNLTRAARPFALLENVVTHADFRGKGFGQAVLRHAMQFAWQKNCYKIMLLTGREDKGTLAFYEKVGFSKQGKQGLIVKPLNPS